MLYMSLRAERSNLMALGIAGGTGILPLILVDRLEAYLTKIPLYPPLGKEDGRGAIRRSLRTIFGVPSIM